MSTFVFYCNDDRSRIEVTEYYKQDIDVLRELGHDVKVCTRFREIPLRFDAIFIWWWTYALWPVLLARLLGRPSIITGVFNFRFPPGFEGTDFFGRPAWQRLLISAATRLCTMNLFVDEAEAKACAAHFRLRNAHYFPCVVHRDYLQGPAAQRELALFNVAWSGRQNLIRKGIPDLLEAVRLLKDRGVAVTLYLAGLQGDGTSFLLEAIEKLQIGDRVTCLGPLSREEKIARLRACEIYAQPSRFEGFGLATAEAMGCGACVITCDVGAVRNVVGDCGIYIPPGSPGELASAIQRAMTDGELRHRLQREAGARATGLFAADKKRERLKGHLAGLGITQG
jgi:glycosyltransferase involved in cell wall biosynthesis